MTLLIAQKNSLNFYEEAVDKLPGVTSKTVIEPSISISNLITTLLQAVMVMAAILVLLFLIWGAFDWITAGGDSGKIQKARDKIMQSIIGILVLASTVAAFMLIQQLLGVEIINFTNSSKANSTKQFSVPGSPFDAGGKTSVPATTK